MILEEYVVSYMKRNEKYTSLSLKKKRKVLKQGVSVLKSLEEEYGEPFFSLIHGYTNGEDIINDSLQKIFESVEGGEYMLTFDSGESLAVVRSEADLDMDSCNILLEGLVKGEKIYVVVNDSFCDKIDKREDGTESVHVGEFAEEILEGGTDSKKDGDVFGGDSIDLNGVDGVKVGGGEASRKPSVDLGASVDLEGVDLEGVK